MAKQQTNFFEIILRDAFIGATVYDEDENPIIVDHLEYNPQTRHVLISNADNSISAKMDIEQDFNFEYPLFTRVPPNRRKIKGKKDKQ